MTQDVHQGACRRIAVRPEWILPAVFGVLIWTATADITRAAPPYGAASSAQPATGSTTNSPTGRNAVVTRSYSIHNLAADQIARTLDAHLPQSTLIQVNRQTNEIRIQAVEPVQRMASQTIAALDRPSGSQPVAAKPQTVQNTKPQGNTAIVADQSRFQRPPAGTRTGVVASAGAASNQAASTQATSAGQPDSSSAGQPSVQTYRYREADLADATEALKQRFAPLSGVRITCDPQMQRIVVLAPDHIQALVADALQDGSLQRSTQANRASANRAVADRRPAVNQPPVQASWDTFAGSAPSVGRAIYYEPPNPQSGNTPSNRTAPRMQPPQVPQSVQQPSARNMGRTQYAQQASYQANPTNQQSTGGSALSIRHEDTTQQAPQQEMPKALGSVVPGQGGGPIQQSVHPSQSEVITLNYLTAQQFEKRMSELLGRRCIPVQNYSPDAQIGLYKLPMVDGTNLTLTVNRKNREVMVLGAGPGVQSCVRLVQYLDREAGEQGNPASGNLEIVSFNPDRVDALQRAVAAIEVSNQAPTPGSPMSNMPETIPRPSPEALAYLQSTSPSDQQPLTDNQGNQIQFGATTNPGDPASAGEAGSESNREGLMGPVQIEMLEGLDFIVIRGDENDVRQVIELINQIESMSLENEPQITIYQMRNASSQRVGDLVRELYNEVFSVRQGSVSITSLIKPNAILLVGRPESVATATDLIRRLDKPVAPNTQFQVFRLRHAAADTVAEQIDEFFSEREGLGTEVRVTADYRSNSLVVQAAPRDLVEVAAMVMKLDTSDSESVNELRVITLRHTMAEELADVLNEAINGTAAGGNNQNTSDRSSALSFSTLDAGQQRMIRSGILSDVRITPDVRSNSLLISAPADSIPLLQALVQQMDQLPLAESQIKVFTIINSDAAGLVDMLETLFDEGNQTNEPSVRTGANPDDSTLVGLRFAVDVRTNSIIVSGTAGDLSVVEAILLRLDESDVQNRVVEVYKLSNLPADLVATAINEYLQNERQVEQSTTGLISTFEQIEREVVVVPETESNSLIVSTTPRYFDQIISIIKKLDERPPMVMIQVLIAEVDLGNAHEFGIEAGLQDQVLFDRSAVDNVVTVNKTTQGAGNEQITTQEIISQDYNPGYNFNNLNPLGNSGVANPLTVGSQGLSNFGMGRTNSELGFGGFVFSASSGSLSILLRALEQNNRLDILSRPSIMTMNNQAAFIQIGSRVPRISAMQVTDSGNVTNSITDEDVGLILGVTPRITPEGLVVMEIDAEKSKVGPSAEGVPIGIQNGQAIYSPPIDTITAQTTVSAMSGQTVVLGGLITKEHSEVSRRVPYLASIPILGHMFRYDSTTDDRSELIIILTPQVVDSDCDIETIKHSEAQRMHWIMCDVAEFADDFTLRKRTDEWSAGETEVIYPGMIPSNELLPSEPGIVIPESQYMSPTPAGPLPMETMPQDGLPLETIPMPGQSQNLRRPPVLPTQTSYNSRQSGAYRSSYAGRPAPMADPEVMPAGPPRSFGNAVNTVGYQQ